MTHTSGSPNMRVQRVVLVAGVVFAIAWSAISVEAGQRGARLSRDLAERLAARVEASSDVIVTASEEQVQTLATRYGARIKKRLLGGAVLEVTGGQLQDLSQDSDVVSLSGDLPVRTMGVTAETIG